MECESMENRLVSVYQLLRRNAARKGAKMLYSQPLFPLTSLAAHAGGLTRFLYYSVPMLAFGFFSCFASLANIHDHTQIFISFLRIHPKPLSLLVAFTRLLYRKGLFLTYMLRQSLANSISNAEHHGYRNRCLVHP